MKRWIYFCILLAVHNCAWAEETLVNAVSFEQGSVLLSYTSEYGDRASIQWLALGLVDGTAEMGWASKKFTPSPHEFIFELATTYDIRQVNFDNSNTEEKTHPGISSKTGFLFINLGRGQTRGNLTPASRERSKLLF